MMSEESQFSEMLDKDKELFTKITQGESLLKSYKAKIDTQGGLSVVSSAVRYHYQTLESRLLALRDSYNQRQDDIQNNTFYNIGQSLESAGDAVIDWSVGLWNDSKKFFGLGEPITAVLIIPAIYGAAAVISVLAISYFVSSYYEKSLVDYDEGFALVAEMYKTDPAKAREMERALRKAKRAQDASSITGSIGSGIKTALILGAVIYGVSKLPKGTTEKVTKKAAEIKDKAVEKVKEITSKDPKPKTINI